MARRRSTRSARIAVGIACGVLFAGYLFWSLRAEETFRVLNKSLEQTQNGVVVSGEIYNASPGPASVNVEVSFFDPAGRQLANEVVTLNEVAVGASAPFRTQPKNLPQVKNYSIYVNTGRNMYGN